MIQLREGKGLILAENLVPQRAHRLRFRRDGVGRDSRVSLALEPQRMLELPELAIRVVRGERGGFRDEAEARGELEQREVPDVAGQLRVLVRKPKHEVL